jgi:cyclopropane-fatty-acyl-phospholipid synthase
MSDEAGVATPVTGRSSQTSPLTRLSGYARLTSALHRRLARPDQPPFEVTFPGGETERFGSDVGEPRFRLTLHSSEAAKALASLDESRVGEAYMDGLFDVSGDFMSALDLRKSFTDRHPILSVWRFVSVLLQGRVKADKSWVPHHYDFGNDFYFAFLDKDYRLYSQALYRTESDTLEQAVRNKLDYIEQVCRLGPGSRVLDVGGGWGSFASFAAARGVDVTMLTISHEQYKWLTEWSRSNKSQATVKAVYESIFAYESAEPYDAVVILGVMEHLPEYARLLAQLDTLMKPNARLYMDFVANRKKYDVSSFTYKHVFPGDHTPVHMPELLEAANASPFEIVAIHNDRHSYYRTLRAWAERIEAASAELIPRFGQKTYRLFQTYLWGGAHLLERDGGLESYRVVLQKSAGRKSDGVGLDTD